MGPARQVVIESSTSQFRLSFEDKGRVTGILSRPSGPQDPFSRREGPQAGVRQPCRAIHRRNRPDARQTGYFRAKGSPKRN